MKDILVLLQFVASLLVQAQTGTVQDQQQALLVSGKVIEVVHEYMQQSTQPIAPVVITLAPEKPILGSVSSTFTIQPQSISMPIEPELVSLSEIAPRWSLAITTAKQDNGKRTVIFWIQSGQENKVTITVSGQQKTSTRTLEFQDITLGTHDYEVRIDAEGRYATYKATLVMNDYEML